MSAIPLHLLPDSAEVGEDGHLLIGGCDTLDLAEQYGTPLFVYDERHLRDRCREAVEAFGGRVEYATKAFSCVAMCRLAHEEGLHLDVSTGGEYHVARTAGVPASGTPGNTGGDPDGRPTPGVPMMGRVIEPLPPAPAGVDG